MRQGMRELFIPIFSIKFRSKLSIMRKFISRILLKIKYSWRKRNRIVNLKIYSPRKNNFKKLLKILIRLSQQKQH